MVLSPRLSGTSHRTPPSLYTWLVADHPQRMLKASTPCSGRAALRVSAGKRCPHAELNSQPIQMGHQGLSYSSECGWAFPTLFTADRLDKHGILFTAPTLLLQPCCLHQFLSHLLLCYTGEEDFCREWDVRGKRPGLCLCTAANP